jgi:hypothetical protein
MRRKYPFYLIPKLTGKHPISQLIYPNEEFYRNRERQLNYYLCFISSHEFLKQTKEFYKFLNDAEFDENYFLQDESPYQFTNTLKITETMKNKIYGVFTGLFGKKEELRRISEDEVLIFKMENHYKGILKTYIELKDNMSTYFKGFISHSEEFKTLSQACFYLKDTFSADNQIETKNNFKNFHYICKNISTLNRMYHEQKAIDLENNLEVFILIM